MLTTFLPLIETLYNNCQSIANLIIKLSFYLELTDLIFNLALSLDNKLLLLNAILRRIRHVILLNALAPQPIITFLLLQSLVEASRSVLITTNLIMLLLKIATLSYFSARLQPNLTILLSSLNLMLSMLSTIYR